MKKTLGLVAALLLVGGFAFAEEATLIDFTYLDADTVTSQDSNEPQQNGRTIMDFSISAGATFTGEQKKLMKTSLALPEWEIVLNSSAKNVASLADSKVIAAPVKTTSEQPFAGKNVMGVRIIFPTWNSNANAKIIPPFDIPAYEPVGSIDSNGNRVPASEGEDTSAWRI